MPLRSFHNRGSTIRYSAVAGGNVQGLGNSPGTFKVAFNDVKIATPLVIGALNTRNEVDGGFLRLSSVSATSADFFVQEDMYCDTELAHASEKVSLIAWSEAANVDTLPTTTTTTPGSIIVTLDILVPIFVAFDSNIWSVNLIPQILG